MVKIFPIYVGEMRKALTHLGFPNSVLCNQIKLTMKSIKMKSILTSLIAIAILPLANAQEKLDPALPIYTPVSGVTGNLNSIGSDTLNNMMTLWAEAFKTIYPNVNIQIEGKGSSTAPAALIEGTAQLGPMSRAMKSKEKDEFEKKYGYKPTEVGVAIDALAVFTHKDNPLKGLTLQQVDSVFSSTYKSGGQPIKKWGEVGLTGDFASRAIGLYGRNSASGTYGFFKEVALNKGDFSADVKEQPGSSSVVQSISSDLYGIGYSGIGYKTSGVNAIMIADKKGKMIEPSSENCLNGTYPLARTLFVYINKKPNEKLDKLTYEFLRFVLSKQGQGVVVKDGYFALPADVANKILKSIE